MATPLTLSPTTANSHRQQPRQSSPAPPLRSSTPMSGSVDGVNDGTEEAIIGATSGDWMRDNGHRYGGSDDDLEDDFYRRVDSDDEEYLFTEADNQLIETSTADTESPPEPLVEPLDSSAPLVSPMRPSIRPPIGPLIDLSVETPIETSLMRPMKAPIEPSMRPPIGSSMRASIEPSIQTPIARPSKSPSIRPSSGGPSIETPVMATRADPRAEFERHLRLAFDNRVATDLRFKVDDEVIDCHQTVLKIRCQKFYANCHKYLQNCHNNSNVILIQSYSFEAFHSFIAYLYGISAPVVTDRTVGALLKLATTYEEQELKDWCLRHVSMANVCSLYEQSVDRHWKDLEIACFEFMTDNWRSVCGSDQFWAMDETLSKRLMAEFVK